MQSISGKVIFIIFACACIIAGIINVSNYYNPSEINTHGIPTGILPGILYIVLGVGWLVTLIFRRNKNV